jgi:hypothetical protein
MSNNFKTQATQQRAAIPQVDPEAAKPILIPVNTSNAKPKLKTVKPVSLPRPEVEEVEALIIPIHLTRVDTTETPTNRGFSMFPSRHRQVAKDLAYLEDRNPWQIIDDALEEYVLKHYGKDYKRV